MAMLSWNFSKRAPACEPERAILSLSLHGFRAIFQSQAVGKWGPGGWVNLGTLENSPHTMSLQDPHVKVMSGRKMPASRSIRD